MIFSTNLTHLQGELRDVIRLFIPFFDADLNISLFLNNNKCDIKIAQKEYNYYLEKSFNQDEKEDNRRLLKAAKIALYKALSVFFNKELPWGSLTGIRPTKIAYKYLQNGGSISDATNYLCSEYFVSSQKAELTGKILQAQRGLLFANPDYINLYVHIPFCPTRCKYCSFTALPAQKYSALIQPYLDFLIQEIRAAKKIIESKRLLSVYVGGGTPTVLDAQQLNVLLKSIDFKGGEFTVEAGRPDTINTEKLQVLRQNNVTRISVNPQTFCNKTLKAIGRDHTASQAETALIAAKNMGFDVNMDIIAGLPDEDMQDFNFTLSKAVDLSPQNITVHTLSVKNGSDFFNHKNGFNNFTEEMVEHSVLALTKAGYSPYYLYRQKNMSHNLENTGYCQQNKQSVFNITSMEESVSVLGVGAGAISKRVIGSRIERLANLRDVDLYIKQHDQRLKRMLDFWA